MKKIFAVLATVSVVIIIASTAFADHGRFLEETASSSDVFKYGQSTPTTFDQDVGIYGKIKFDYDICTREPGGTGQGCGALAGGFYYNPMVEVIDNFTLHWVQTVTATRNGLNDWNFDPASSDGEFPDADPQRPWYSYEATPTSENPDVGYYDLPSRNFAGGNHYWIAELGLVGISDTANLPGGFTEVRVVDTFLWGFDLNPESPYDINDVVSSSPELWSDPTSSFLNTLNGFYDGLGGKNDSVVSEKFQFSSNDNVFTIVPEPISSMLFLIGGATLGFRRLRKRVRS